MLDILEDHMHKLSASGKNLTRWKQTMDLISTRTALWKDRFKGTYATKHAGVELLASIIRSVYLWNIDYLLTLSDLDMYNYLEANAEDALNSAYGTDSRKKPMYNMFLHGSEKVPEFFLTSSMRESYNDIPFGASYSFWESFHGRGFRLVSHDANEIPGGFLNWKIQFSTDVNYVVYTIDPVILLMRYLKYTQYTRLQGERESVYDYLKEYELIHLFDDFQSIWLRNYVNSYLNTDPVMYDQLPLKTTVPSFYTSINTIIRGSEDIITNLELLRNGQITPAVFLSSNWHGQHSIITDINTQLTDVSIVTLRQLKPVLFMRDFPYIATVLKLILLYGKNNQFQDIFNKLNLELRNIDRSSILNEIQNSTIRELLKEQLLSLTDLMENT